MKTLNPLLFPLDIWSSIGDGLNAMMQPIYWAISGLLVGFHWLFSQFMDPNGGWTWFLAIISLTVVVRSALIPLFVKQITSSRKMQLLGPKVKALQDKYGADRERLGQETMKLYKAENVNPAASCLPVFLQMPIFIGLFNVLNSVSMGVPMGEFFVRETQVGGSNPLVASLKEATVFGAKISGRFTDGMASGIGSTQFVAAFLIVVMVVTLFFTQLHMMRKNMPPEAMTGQMAQQQKTMLYMFPGIYLITGVSVPIGVMMYWAASNLWTLAQQSILIHNSPAPNTPAYIDWEERMRAKGKDPEAVLQKRLGIKPGSADVENADPTRVMRQGVSRQTNASDQTEQKKPRKSAPSAESSPSDTSPSGRQQIQRQQPAKQTRANRKTAQPRQTGETPKE